jgi:hypothetical protein
MVENNWNPVGFPLRTGKLYELKHIESDYIYSNMSLQVQSDKVGESFVKILVFKTAIEPKQDGTCMFYWNGWTNDTFTVRISKENVSNYLIRECVT